MLEGVLALIFGSVAIAGIVLVFLIGSKIEENNARRQREKLERFFEFLLEFKDDSVSVEKVVMFLEAMNEKK